MSDFSRSTLARLAKRGISVTGLTMLVGDDGSYANADTAYVLDNNGERQIRRHSEVLSLAA